MEIETKFLVNSIPVLEFENGNYIFRYVPPRNSDMISNIRASTNVTIQFKIGGILYPSTAVKEFLFLCSGYHEFQIVFTFLKKPEQDEVFTLWYHEHRFDSETRVAFSSGPLVKSNILYVDNMTYRLFGDWVEGIKQSNSV